MEALSGADVLVWLRHLIEALMACVLIFAGFREPEWFSVLLGGMVPLWIGFNMAVDRQREKMHRAETTTELEKSHAAAVADLEKSHAAAVAEFEKAHAVKTAEAEEKIAGLEHELVKANERHRASQNVRHRLAAAVEAAGWRVIEGDAHGQGIRIEPRLDHRA